LIDNYAGIIKNLLGIIKVCESTLKRKISLIKSQFLVGSAGILPAMARSVAEIADYQPF